MAQGKRGKGKGERLEVARTGDIPLREVSGICVTRDRYGRRSLVAIGDRVAVAAWSAVPESDKANFEWKRLDIARLHGSRLRRHDPQIEAICADGAGRVLLLQETPARAELIDPAAARVVASIDLAVPGGDKLARSWSDPKGSRGEGALLLPGGHLLVAKEKRPRALIEFGPPGARPRGLAPVARRGGSARWDVADGSHRYVALAVWCPDKHLSKACEDFSDLEIGPDNRVYVLSDQSESIARLDELPRGGGSVTASAVWRIRGLRGKPEGLAFTAEGRAVLALDSRKPRRNLVLLDPPIAVG